MVWQRGNEGLAWEAATLIPSGYHGHELVFRGGVRYHVVSWLPCTIHDVVRMWQLERRPFDRDVLERSGTRTVRDGSRPFSVIDHCGGVVTGYGMSWGKPLKALELAMAYTKPGEVVWDPCGGSGTALIAAEKHGRTWIGMELQPRWCDLIVHRWRKVFGSEPRRIKSDCSDTG